MIARRHAASLLAAACAAVGLGACGPPSPQVPLARAGTVANALTGITTTCGYSYQELAFTPHPDLQRLEASAAANVRALAGVVVENPHWVYQGKTLAEISVLSIRYLDGCALRDAARLLQRDTRARLSR